jgi:acylphosphatase/uncharacterized protein YukE
MERAIAIVRGRVHMVGYRDYVAEEANRLDLGGIVRNLPDKTVEVIAEGDRGTLDAFIALLWAKNDPMIKVTGVEVKFLEASNEYEYFEIEYADFSQEGFERIGMAASYLKRIDTKQDQMLGKQDQMLGKQDQMLGKQDQMLGKQDQMLGKQEETNEGINRMDVNLTQTNESIQKLDKNLSQTNESIKHMDGHVTDRFDRMDVKYDKMSDRMEKIDKTLERLADALIKIAENRN